jgi:hypothetical protein
VASKLDSVGTPATYWAYCTSRGCWQTSVEKLLEWELAGETKKSEKTAPKPLFDHIFHTAWQWSKPGPPQWESGDWFPELRHGYWIQVRYTTVDRNQRQSYVLLFYTTNKSFYLTMLSQLHGSRDSAVGRATGYGLYDREVGVRVPLGSRIFTSPCSPDRL